MDAELHPESAFPAILDSLFFASGIIVESIVSAHGGETTDDAVERVDWDVTPIDADVIVFAYGSNDFFRWGTPAFSRVSIDRFRFNCRILFRKLSGLGGHVVVLAPPPVLAQRFYEFFDSTMYLSSGGVSALRSRYTEVLDEVAAEFIQQICVIRADSIFLNDDDLIGFDGVHPLPDGHRRIAETLLPILMQKVEEGRFDPVPADAMEFFPSPFQRSVNGVSVVEFPASDTGEYVLRIFDSAGRQIRKIVYYVHTPGNHSIFWNGRRADGTLISAGAYTLSLESRHQHFRLYPISVY